MEEGRIASRLPQVDSGDDFVVAPEINALLRRSPYSERCLCTVRDGGTDSII